MRVKRMIIVVLTILLVISLVVLYFVFFNMDKLIRQETMQETQLNRKEEGIESKENSIQELGNQIDAYLEKNDIDTNKLSIYITDLETEESYSINENVDFLAASIYKLPLAMLYYEKINDGILSYKQSYTLKEEYYEEGGPIGKLEVGTNVSLENLLYNVIVNSDNTAGHILFENLGGWINFKKEAVKYTSLEMGSTFYSYDNVLSAAYMNDVLKYLYTHKSEFAQLIEDLKIATPNDFLNKNINNSVMQKYGFYASAYNSVGLSIDGYPYSIVVFTNLNSNGVQVMADINEICYTYFNKDK